MASKMGLTRKQFWWLVIFVIGLFLPGAYGFVEKFAILVVLLFTDNDGGFTIVPILNYLLVACGMLCLFAWAVAHGMFRDIEAPKHELLRRERMLDEEQGIHWES
jgi:hypothetical protein